MRYQLPPPCYPKIFPLSLSLSPPSLLPSSTYLPRPIPKYQYKIAADPGSGIGLVQFHEDNSLQHLGHNEPSSPSTKGAPRPTGLILKPGFDKILETNTRAFSLWFHSETIAFGMPGPAEISTMIG